MTAVAMILAAGMALGDGPEPVSAETRESLHMDGAWEGESQQTKVGSYPLRFAYGQLYGQFPRTRQWKQKGTPCKFIDEGEGRLRFSMGSGPDSLGIYQQSGDHVVICCGYRGKRRPTRFAITDEQVLFIFHRVRPQK